MSPRVVWPRAELPARALASAASALLLAGCATFNDKGGFAPVAEMATKHTGQEALWVRNIDELPGIDRRVARLDRVHPRVHARVALVLATSRQQDRSRRARAVLVAVCQRAS